MARVEWCLEIFGLSLGLVGGPGWDVDRSLLTIRDQVHQPGDSCLVLMYLSGSSWENGILVSTRDSSVTSSGDTLPQFCKEWEGALDYPLALARRCCPFQEPCAQSSYCLPGSPSSARPLPRP